MFNHIKTWMYVLLFVLLLNPVLYLYNSDVIPKKVQTILDEFNLYSQSYELSLDVANLINHAQGYMLQNDISYLEKFNQSSMIVLKKALDIENKVDPQTRNEIKELIKLTEEYISFVTSSLNKYHYTYSAEEVIMERHNQLATELMNRTNQLLSRNNESMQSDFSNLDMLENSFNILASLLIVLTIILLVFGTYFIIYPLLQKYYQISSIVAHGNDVTLVVDAKGNVLRISNNAEKIVGLSPAEATDKTIDFITSKNPHLQSIFHPILRVLIDHKRIMNNQVVYQQFDQKLFFTVDYHPFYFLKRFSGVIVIISSTKIKKDESYLYDAIESERKKISLEIHDWIGRNMSAIIHSFDYILRSNTGKIPIEIQNDLIKLRTHCQEAVIDMRSIMYEIHPYLIDKVGLIPTLEAYSRTFEQMQNLKVNLFYQNKHLSLHKTKEIVIFRIMQEALSNVVKHSSATEVDLYISKEKETLKVEIMDNGTPDEEFIAGKGLWGMKERAHSIGGDLVFSGNKQTGFIVMLTAPISKEEQMNEQN